MSAYLVNQHIKHMSHLSTPAVLNYLNQKKNFHLTETKNLVPIESNKPHACCKKQRIDRLEVKLSFVWLFSFLAHQKIMLSSSRRQDIFEDM